MTPSSTYPLQFHAGFTFRDARRLVRYLHDLGISHVYTSPYLRARSGSTHGYDVADPNALNPELGSQADYDAFVAELQRFGMGQLVDVVPNHMGIGDPGNFRWLDVLENGPASMYARFFDINWRNRRSSCRRWATSTGRCSKVASCASSTSFDRLRMSESSSASPTTNIVPRCA